MSWHYLQEPEEGFSVAAYLDGLRSERSRSRSTLGASSSNGCETGRSSPSLSIQTCRPLTAGRGEMSSTSSPEASPVRTLAWREKVKASMELDQGYGERWPASWVRFDLASFSWRTRQCSLLGGSDVFSGTWPRWGTMRGGECWAHDTPEHPTDATGSGSWLATPTATANQLSPSGQKHPGCQNWWPTPTKVHRPNEGNVRMLRRQAMAGVISWEEAKIMSGGKDVRQRQGALPAMRGADNIEPVETGGKLNPEWVEWLMGWPIGFTACRRLEMDKCQQWSRLHGISSGVSNE